MIFRVGLIADTGLAQLASDHIPVLMGSKQVDFNRRGDSMAKKDTYLALLRRGIDESTAEILADAGLKIGDIKKLSQDQLEQNYGLKPEIASKLWHVK